MSTESFTPRATPQGQAPARVPSASETSSLATEAAPKPRFNAAIVEWALIVSSYVVLFFENHWVGSDGGMRFDALSQILEGRGLPREKLSLVGPLFSTPLWYFGKVVLKDARLGCAYYNWLVFGIGLVVFARLLKGILAPSMTRRFLLILAAGSMFTYHVQAYYGEVFTAVCVACGLLSVCTKRSGWLGWIAIVLGAANTPAAGLATGVVCLYFVFDRKRVRYLVPITFVIAISVVESMLHRGGLHSGYEGTRSAKTFMPYSGLPDFSYPILLGVLGLLLSFGKGILFYAPGVFARVTDLLEGQAKVLAAYRLWLLFLAGLVVVYAKWWGWYGGEFWGPRYILFSSIPASFALALNLGKQRSVARCATTLVMLTLSIWIAADGTLFGQENLGECSANVYSMEHLCWYVPEFAAWIRPFIVSRPLTGQDWAFISVYGAVYLYLAAPLVAFLVRSIFPPWVARVRQLVVWKAWAF